MVLPFTARKLIARTWRKLEQHRRRALRGLFALLANEPSGEIGGPCDADKAMARIAVLIH